MITGELVNVVAECVKVPFLIFCTALIPCPQLSDSLPIDPPPPHPPVYTKISKILFKKSY